MKPVLSQDRLQRVILSLAVVALTCTVAAGAVAYLRTNPGPVGWDEAGYVNQVISDHFTLTESGIVKFLRTQVSMETWRPP